MESLVHIFVNFRASGRARSAIVLLGLWPKSSGDGLTIPLIIFKEADKLLAKFWKSLLSVPSVILKTGFILNPKPTQIHVNVSMLK